MDEQRKMDAAAQRFADLKQALDKTPLWDQLAGAATSASAQVTRALSEVINDLAYLCTRDDGWLRITNKDAGRKVYFKFKFTSEKHWNTYVYYETDGPQMGEGLDGLRRKYDEVQRGERKPTKDRPYRHRDE